LVDYVFVVPKLTSLLRLWTLANARYKIRARSCTHNLTAREIVPTRQEFWEGAPEHGAKLQCLQWSR